MEKEYDLRGKKYVQRPLVLGQFRALLPLLDGLEIKENSSPFEMINTLGDRIHKALAIVLIEEEIDLRKALDEIEDRAREIECVITPEQVLEVIEDFFECNRVSSVIEKLAGMMGNIKSKIGEKPAVSPVEPSTSNKSSGGSQAETSPEGKKSSGA